MSLAGMICVVTACLTALRDGGGTVLGMARNEAEAVRGLQDFGIEVSRKCPPVALR